MTAAKNIKCCGGFSSKAPVIAYKLLLAIFNFKCASAYIHAYEKNYFCIFRVPAILLAWSFFLDNIQGGLKK